MIRIDAPWLQTAGLQKLLSTLADGGHEARVVGGAVRDTLAGNSVHEIDIATTARPEQVCELCAAQGFGVHPTGIAHGTVTVVADGQHYEVTTLRRDVATDGRRAVVAFTDAWDEDAERRDFTINAIYADADGALFDPTGGVADLAARRVRFIGDATQRIREDYLRILRFFRFSAEFADGALDAEGLAATVALKEGLARLSAERVWMELKKLFVERCAADVAVVMEQQGLLNILFSRPTHAKALGRLVAIERGLALPADAIGRLAALAGPGGDEALADRLRLSRTEFSDLGLANSSHPGLDPSSSEAAGRAAVYQLGSQGFARAQRLLWARGDADVHDPDWRRRNRLAQRFTPPALPYTGADVVTLGLAPGPRVGSILRAFEAWWIDSDFPSEPALLSAKLRAIAAQG